MAEVLNFQGAKPILGMGSLSTLISANDADAEDCTSCMAAIGSEVLDGEEIFSKKELAETNRQSAINELTQYANQLSGMNSIWNSVGASIIQRKITATQAEVADYDAVIRECDEKMAQFDQINAATSSLFQTGPSIRSVAQSMLSSIAGAFQNGTYSPDMSASWRQPDYLSKQLEATRYLVAEGITAQEIAYMLELGFQPSDLKEHLIQFSEEFDRKFLIHLMDGEKSDFEKAFQIDPQSLSPEMTLFLTDYTYRLIEYDKISTFEDFNNALLGTLDFVTDGAQSPASYRFFRDEYMAKLYAGASVYTKSLALALSTKQYTDVDYVDLFREYQHKFALMNLWATEVVMINQFKRQSTTWNKLYGETQNLKISNLQYDADGIFSFDMTRFSHYYFYLGNITNTVTVDNVLTGMEYEDAQDTITLRNLALAEERLIEELARKLVEGAALTATTILAPELAVMVALVNMAIEGENGNTSMTSLYQPVENPIARLLVKEGETIIVNTTNYLIKLKATSDKLDAENRRIHMKWFGSGGTYVIDGGRYETRWRSEQSIKDFSSLGIYNPDTLRWMQMWEEKGLASLPVWEISKSQYVTLQEAFDKKKKQLEAANPTGSQIEFSLEIAVEELTPSQQQLVMGGVELTEITEYEQFIKDIRAIQDWYADHIGRMIEIRPEWDKLSKESFNLLKGEQ